MFLKNSSSATKVAAGKKEATPSLITQDMNIIGNIVSEGNIDFEGIINGNIRCNTLTIRAGGCVKGEIVATNLLVYGKVKGLIRAKNVHLFASCNVEGIIMHETIAIEDGAFVDGKFKRTDKIDNEEEEGETEIEFTAFEDEPSPIGDTKILENIRLIR